MHISLAICALPRISRMAHVYQNNAVPLFILPMTDNSAEKKHRIIKYAICEYYKTCIYSSRDWDFVAGLQRHKTHCKNIFRNEKQLPVCDDYGTLCGCDLHATFLLFSQINPLFCLNIRSNGSRAVHIRIRMDGIAIPSSNVSHISKRFHRSIFVYARPSILRTTKYGCTTWSRQND